MVIGYGVVRLRMEESGSLKDKRSILNKILKRVQNEFNVSIAQVGDLDDRNFAQIGFSMTGNESRYINGKVDHLLRFIDDLRVADVLSSKVELMVISDFLEDTDWEAGKYHEV